MIGRRRDVAGWAFDHGLVFYRRRFNAFDSHYVDTLGMWILASPYLAANNLNYRFSGTLGFSVVFRREGMERVRREFPPFAAYLDATVDADSNAFFLNPLVLGRPALDSPRARVAPHVDRSLRSFTMPAEPPNPRRVTVLYTRVPSSMQGGELRLYHRLLPVGRIRPQQGLLIEFQGWLRHEVTATEVEVDEPRVSLVCEHYRLEEDLLHKIPTYTVRSMSPFNSFMEAELEREADTQPAPGRSPREGND